METKDAKAGHPGLRELDETQDALNTHDEEVLSQKKEEDVTPIPYTLHDKLLERFLRPLCTVLLLPLSVAILVITAQILWFLTEDDEAEILVPAAFQYNKGMVLPQPSKFEYNVKYVLTMLGAGVIGVLPAGLYSLAFGLYCLVVPRDKRLRIPSLKFVSEILDVCFTLCAYAVGSLAYAMYYERDAAHGSGCYTYTDRKGHNVTRCSLESAACYITSWPEPVRSRSGFAVRLCHKVRAVRWLTTGVGLCAFTLFTVYKHQKRLQVHYTSAEQRQAWDKKFKEDQERKEKERQENMSTFQRSRDIFRNYVLPIVSIFSILHALVRWYYDN